MSDSLGGPRAGGLWAIAWLGAVVALAFCAASRDRIWAAEPVREGEAPRRLLIAVRADRAMTGDEVRAKFEVGIRRSDCVSCPRVEVIPIDSRAFAALSLAATGERDTETPAAGGIRFEPLPGRELQWVIRLADPFDFLEELLLIDGRSQADSVAFKPAPRSGSGTVRFFSPGSYVLDARKLPSAILPKSCRLTVRTGSGALESVELAWPAAEMCFLVVLCEFRGPTEEVTAAMRDLTAAEASFQEIDVPEAVNLILAEFRRAPVSEGGRIGGSGAQTVREDADVD